MKQQEWSVQIVPRRGAAHCHRNESRVGTSAISGGADVTDSVRPVMGRRSARSRVHRACNQRRQCCISTWACTMTDSLITAGRALQEVKFIIHLLLPWNLTDELG